MMKELFFISPLIVQLNNSEICVGPSSIPKLGPSTFTLTNPPHLINESILRKFQSWHSIIPLVYMSPPFYMITTYTTFHYFNHPPQTSHEIPEITLLGYSEEPTNKIELEDQGQHHLRDHPLLPLVQYTPRSDAIPPRTNHR